LLNCEGVIHVNPNQPRQIFLGNIPYDATPQEVVASLRNAGVGAERVRIATYKETGAPRGFGFLDLASSEPRSTETVIEYINSFEIVLYSRVLRADIAKERPFRPGKDHKGREGREFHEEGRAKRGKRPGGGRGKGAHEFQRGDRDFDKAW